MRQRYRCGAGHVWWMPSEGAAPRLCPVCGSSQWEPLATEVSLTEQTVFPPAEPVILAAPVAQMDPVGKSPTQTLPVRQLRWVQQQSVYVTTDGISLDEAVIVDRPAEPSEEAAIRNPSQGTGDSLVQLFPQGPEEQAVSTSGPATAATLPQIPGYEILGEVGRGGMGVVYKARQLSLNRVVALKMILAGAHADADTRARFRREAEAVAALQHPYIVQIYEIGEAGGHLYLALEYVEGGNLATHLQHGPWPAHLAAELTLLLAQAVDYAHQQGVIHRDLKPANVLLRRVPVAQSDTAALPATASHSPRETVPWCLPRQLEPKVTDFGLAKRLEEAQTGGTRSGAVMGTPSYIAPEQAAGRIRDIGPAVDIYALGAILYELLTGRPPFLGETPLETILQVLHDEPVPPRRLVPGLPADLETICLKCLEKQPSRRYPTASALAQDLRRFLEGEPISARPLSGRERLGRWIRRHPVWSVLAAASLTTVLVLLIGLTTAYLQVRAAVRQREAEAAAARQARLDEAAARQQAEALAQENERRRQEAEQTNARLQREIEERRRSSYALQLMQIATVAEHDPTRALYLLDDQQRCPVDLRDFTWAYLQQLCQRQHLVYQHHSDRLTPPAIIRTAVWSPKGSFIASADDTGQIRLWDPRTGQTWMAGQAHAGRISALAFSPDETLLITAGAGDGALRLWELPLALLQEARRSVEFLPPLRPLVRPMRLHRPYREVLQAHGEAGISALAVSPDGRYLVTGATDGTLQWWDLAAVLPVPPVLADRRQAMPRAALIGGLALAPLAPPPRGPLRPLFDVPLPAHLVPAAPPDAAQPSLDGVTCLSFARESSLLVSGGSDGHARIWTAQGNRLLWSSDQLNAPIRAVALSPDGRTLAVADGTPIIRLILWQSALPIIRRFSGHTAAVYSLAFSQDGEWLASGGFDRTVRLWDMRGQELSVLLGHSQLILTVGFHPDRTHLLSTSTDGTIRVWRTQPLRCYNAELSLSDSAAAAAASSDGRVVLFAPGGSLGEPTDYLIAGWWPRYPQAHFRLVPLPIDRLPGKLQWRSLLVSADDRLILASGDTGKVGGQLWLWRRVPARNRIEPYYQILPQPLLQLPHAAYALVEHAPSRQVALLNIQGLWLWKMPSREALEMPKPSPEPPRLIYPTPQQLAKDCQFDPTGRYLALAIGREVLIVDLTGQIQGRCTAPSQVLALAWGGQHGQWLAVAHSNGVQVWQWHPPAAQLPAQLHRQADITGHNGAVYALAFSPNGRTLASGGDDRVVVLSDPQTGQERARLTGHTERIIRLQFLPGATALLSFTRDGAVKYWPAAPPHSQRP